MIQPYDLKPSDGCGTRNYTCANGLLTNFITRRLSISRFDSSSETPGQ